VRSDCTYRSRVAFEDRGRIGSGRLTVYAHFEGNTYLLPKDAESHGIRAAP
jgi:hypothetical protein